MNKLDKIYQQFVGKDKIQALNIIPGKGKKWILRYKEGGRKIFNLECENREFLDKLLVEFGGKNPETCRADDKFLEPIGWHHEDINELGHRITKVMFSGYRTVRNTSYPVILPDNVGAPPLRGAKRDDKKEILLYLKDREHIQFTQSFKNGEEFDKLVEFITNHKALGKLRWAVMIMGTEARESGDQLVWKRLKAGDGTKRMVLELIGLNTTHYTDCVRQELFDAAGDMFHAPCQRVGIKKKKEQTEEICMFAAEDGKLDHKLKNIEV